MPRYSFPAYSRHVDNPVLLTSIHPIHQAAALAWGLIVAAIGLPIIVLIAWAMWLTFAALIAKWYGLEGLRAVRKVARGFRPLEWASLGLAAARQREKAKEAPDRLQEP